MPNQLCRLVLLLAGLLLGAACQTAQVAPVSEAGPPAQLAAGEMATGGVDEFDDESGIPDLTGVWTARLRSIYKGVGPLGLGSSEGAEIDYLRLTVVVEIQDKRVFYGTIRSVAPGGEETPPQEIFGAIHSNGETALYLTRAGRGVMHINSPDEIEVCGGRGDEDVMLAFCGPLHRAEPGE